MCRSIKTLFHFEPPATDDEIRAASLQFVRKLSGMNAPSSVNEWVFNNSVDEVAAIARRLVDTLVTTSPFRDRAAEAAKAKARSAERFGRAAAPPRPPGRERQAHELAHVGRALERDLGAHPARVRVLVAGRERARRDVGDEGEVHVEALAARLVLLIAEEAGRRAVDAQPRRKRALEPRLLAQLAPRRLEGRLARLELAADGQPGPEALVADEQDLADVAAEDRDGERAAVGHGRSVPAASEIRRTAEGRVVPTVSLWAPDEEPSGNRRRNLMAWRSKAENGRASSHEAIENVLGQSLVVRGDLSASGGFRIDGTVEGNVESKAAIVVGESGVVRGDLTGTDVVVAGQIMGRVTCSGHLEILAKGRIEGDIDAKSVRIETGGVFRGTSRMGEDAGRAVVATSDAGAVSARHLSPVA